MPRTMDIEWLSRDTYRIADKKYGYGYVHIVFLDCVDEFLFDDMDIIVGKFRDVLQEYFESIKIEE